MYSGWRDVLGYVGLYKINSEGEVYSIKSDRLLKSYLAKSGYKRIGLFCKVRGDRDREVHKLVAEAFHGPCPAGYLTRHLDGNKLNIHPSNLVWGTPQENSDDHIKHGGQIRGEDIAVSKLKASQVIAIFKSEKTQKELAIEYGVSQGSISNIKIRKTWRHLTE